MVQGRLEHTTPARYALAVSGAVGAIPVLIPPVGAEALAVLDRIDGVLLPGSPSNVDPGLYGAADETPEAHDPARDATTMPMIREAVRRGMPVLAICRGVQELNVALGGSLHQRVHLLPGRADHRGQGATPEEVYGPRHRVAVSGWLAGVLGRGAITVNSIHWQAVDRVAAGLVVEGVAEDGTIEAVRAREGGFCVGVQWHPEWGYAGNADSLALFAAFGAACRAWAQPRRQAA